MLLNILLAAVVPCSNVDVRSGPINLTNVDEGLECVIMSQVNVRGRLSDQQWEQVNVTNGTFNSVNLQSLFWADSDLMKIYLRDSTLAGVTFHNSQIKSLDAVKTIFAGVAVRKSEGGWWNIDQSSLDRLNMRESEIENVRVQRSAVTDLNFEKGTANQWNIVDSTVKSMKFDSTTLNGFSVLRSPVEFLALSNVKGSGLNFSEVKFAKISISGGSLKNAAWEKSAFNGVQINQVGLENFLLADTTQFYQGQFTKVSFVASEWRNVAMDFVNFKEVVFRDMKMDHVKIDHARFENVHFGLGSYAGLEFGPNVEFVNCTRSVGASWSYSADHLAARGLVEKEMP